MSKHAVITKASPGQKLIPVPSLRSVHMQAAWARPRKCFPSVCVSNDKHVTSNHKSVDFKLRSGRTFAAKMPSFPMVVFQRESRSVSHFCVFMADLNYGIRFAPNRTNCQLSWPTLPYRLLSSLGSSVTQSIPEFLALRLDSFLLYGERESRQV